MKNQISSVGKFYKAFELKHLIESVPTLIEGGRFNLRYDLMQEENKEYIEACMSGDLVEIADALGDMLYILCGTIIEHGMQHKIEAVFNEIQRSNMSKLDENGKPIHRADGKIMKGENYSKPNLKPILGL